MGTIQGQLLGNGAARTADDGSAHETVVTSNDGLGAGDLTNTFTRDGGNLVVTANRYGRYPEGTASTTVNNPPSTNIDRDGTYDPTPTVLGAIAEGGEPPGNPASAVAADELQRWRHGRSLEHDVRAEVVAGERGDGPERERAGQAGYVRRERIRGRASRLLGLSERQACTVEAPDEVGVLLLVCGSGEALLAGIREL